MPMRDIIAVGHQRTQEQADQVRNALYTRSVRTVIQGDELYEDCKHFREAILKESSASVFQTKKSRDVTPQMLEKWGDYRTVKLTLNKGRSNKILQGFRGSRR